MPQQDRDPFALIWTTGASQQNSIRDPCIEWRPWRGASGDGAQAHRHIRVPAPGGAVALFLLTASESVIVTSGYRP
jgi:hypothetical protein